MNRDNVLVFHRDCYRDSFLHWSIADTKSQTLNPVVASMFCSVPSTANKKSHCSLDFEAKLLGRVAILTKFAKAAKV